jgi:polyphosphate kinase 2 (PPK2 family)
MNRKGFGAMTVFDKSSMELQMVERVKQRADEQDETDRRIVTLLLS